MDTDDPFGSILEFCHVSSSQESHLRHCRFAFETDEAPFDDSVTQNPGDDVFPVASTGIVMVSPPESMEDDGGNGEGTTRDVFETPPEEPAPAVDHRDDPARDEEMLVVDDACTDFSAAVDLGRDMDLWVSEAEMTERLDNELRSSGKGVIEENVSLLKRETASEKGLSEPPSKKVKMLEENLEIPVDERNRDDILKSFEEPRPKSVSPYKSDSLKAVELKNREISANSSAKSMTEGETSCIKGSKAPRNQQKMDICAESSMKTKLDFSAEVVGDGLGKGEEYADGDKLSNHKGERNSVRKNIDDINKFRYAGSGPGANSGKEGKKAEVIRALPLSIFRSVEEGAKEKLNCEKKCERVNLLDVLKALRRDDDYDPSLQNLSLLDVVKRRGMTFP